MLNRLLTAYRLLTKAEGEGFEPPVTLLPQLFSRQPP